MLDEAAEAKAKLDYRGIPTIDLAGEVAAYAYLRVTDEGEAVELRFYPADTLGQARALYADRGTGPSFGRDRDRLGNWQPLQAATVPRLPASGSWVHPSSLARRTFAIR